MLPASTMNQYANMEYNNKHNNLLINGNITTSNDSLVSTLILPSIKSINDEKCSLFSTIHDNIHYSDLSKIQSRAVMRASVENNLLA